MKKGKTRMLMNVSTVRNAVTGDKVSASSLNALLCCCDHCNDGDGNCAYPHYGLAPHKHVGKEMIGSTVINAKADWPDNFAEDCEVEGLGTYTHCLHCGRPNDEALFYKDQDTLEKRKALAT